MSLVDPELAARALERALRHGGELAEVYAEERHGFGLTLDDGRVERPQSGSERGVSIRVVSGESSYFGHVDGLAEEDLLRVADSVAQAASGGDSRPVPLGHPLARGAVFCVRDERFTLAVVTGRFALPSLVFYDLRHVLGDLDPASA